MRKAIILAGGLGTRLQPITRIIPKEMLPLGAKPILQHIIDELKAAGFRDILIVSRIGKPAISEYFSGVKDVAVFEKREALGPGHSVLLAREFAGDESFLVAFGDAPFLGWAGKSFLRKMTDIHAAENAAAVLAVDQVPLDDVHRRAIVTSSDAFKRGVPLLITSIVQKPNRADAASRWAVTGRYTFSPTVFDALAFASTRASGEILLADAIQYMLSEGRMVYGLPLVEGLRRFDTGSLEGYIEAFRFFTS